MDVTGVSARYEDGRFVHDAAVESVVWSADGARLYTCTTDRFGRNGPASALWCWSAAGALLWRVACAFYGVAQAVLSRDGASVYMIQYGGLRCLDALTGALRWEVALQDRFSETAVELESGDLLMMHGYLEFERLDVATRTIHPLRSYDEGNGGYGLALSPDKQRAALRTSAGVWIIDVASAAILQKIEFANAMTVGWVDARTLAVTASQSPRIELFELDGTKWRALRSCGLAWGRNTGFALAHDRRFGAIASSQGEVVAASLETGAQRWRCSPGGEPRGMAYAPDDRVLAVCVGRRVALLDAETGAARWEANPLPFGELSLSADGARLLAGYGADALGAAELDAQTLVPARWLSDASAAYHMPDGQVLCCGERLGFEAGETLSHAPPEGVSWGERRLYKRAAATADGRWLVAAGGGVASASLELWDLHSLNLKKTLVKGGMKAPGDVLAASPDGRFVAAVTEDKADVSLYDAATWKKAARKPAKGQPVGLAWRPDATLLYGVTAKGAAWAMAPDGAVRWEQAHKKVAWTAIAAGGDAVALGDAAGEVRIVDGLTGELRASWSLGAGVSALLLTDAGALYVATEALALHRMDAAAHVGACARVAVALAPHQPPALPQRWHKNALTHVALSPDRALIATGTWVDHDYDGADDEHGDLYIWEVATGRCVRRVEALAWGVGWPNYAQMVQWSPDGAQLGAAWSTNGVGAWMVRSQAQTPIASHDVTDGSSRPPAWCWRPDGQALAIAAWCHSRVAIVEATHTQRHATSFTARPFLQQPAPPDDTFHPGQLVWSRDGRWLSARDRDTVEVYDAHTRQLVHTLGVPGDRCAWSEDGLTLYTSETNLLRALDVGTGDELWRAAGVHQGVPYPSPDGGAVAVVSQDAVMIASPGAAVTLDGAEVSQPGWGDLADTPALAWSPDGLRCAVRGDGRVTIWHLSGDAPQPGWSCAVEGVKGVAWGACDVLVCWDAEGMVWWPIGAKKPTKRHRRP